jgi:putative aldouronate transport system permease protein
MKKRVFSRDPMYNSTADLTMDMTVGLICMVIVLFCLYPFLYTISLSISNAMAVTRGEVKLLPVGFTTAAYGMLLRHPNLINSYGNTIFYTVAGTAWSLVITTMAAYALAKRRFPGKKFFNYFVLFPMLFNGGLIPLFLVVVKLYLFDTRMALIVVGAVSVWNLIILKTFMQSIPLSLKESAKMDGAGDWFIFRKIYIPISKPAISIIALFYAVARWNDFFSALIFLNNEKKFPVQLIIYQLVATADDQLSKAISMSSGAANFTPLSFKAAVVVVTMFPVMVIYPFIQKYFTKGMMIGAIKG